ncbi:MAG: class B sortase [Lachnospiraceae bacterium]|nr:class B sortase [Lachnospiraceae bacterium]
MGITGERRKWNKLDVLEAIKDILLIITITCFVIAGIAAVKQGLDKKRNREETDELRRRVAAAEEVVPAGSDDEVMTLPVETSENGEAVELTVIPDPVMIPGYQALYDDNSDIAGWIRIEDTKIDYPVMQTFGDDGWYYLDKSFSKSRNSNGSLFADPDCVIGSGTKQYDYQDGTHPSTNIIIYGHRMNNGDMFGGLGNYLKKDYGLSHNVIYFDSLYEHRKYELIAVFKSKIFYTDEEVFKYYQFTEAKTKEEFEASVKNIKEMAVYDTGVEAQWGDEFITLSTCDHYTPNGRLVVVGKRVD